MRNKSARVVLTIIALCVSAWAGSYYANSCSYADVNDCVNGSGVNTCHAGSPGGSQATHTAIDGDIVNVPSGSCTWSSQLVINVGMSLIGAGSSSTHITQLGSSTLFSITVPSATSSLMRVSGFDFPPGSYSSSPPQPTIANINGTCSASTCSNIRWDNTTMNGFASWNGSSGSFQGFIMYANNVFGVIDHNTVSFTTGGEFIGLGHSSYLNVGANGDNSWAQPDSYGTGQALYLETNTFSTTYANGMAITDTDVGGGGRFVGRFNTLTNASYQTHGTETSGRLRGGRQAELYNNNLTITSGAQGDLSAFRSGTGLVFNNTVTNSGGQLNAEVSLSLYRINAAFSPWGTCDGSGGYDQNDGTTYDSGTYSGTTGQQNFVDSTKNWTVNQWAPASGHPYSLRNTTQGWGEEIASNTATGITPQGQAICTWVSQTPCTWTHGDSYQLLRATACIDQPTRGGNGATYLSGTTPSPTGWPSEPIDPIYEWGSTTSGGSFGWGWISTKIGTQRLIANRDFYYQNASFNGTSGTGTGTRALRPLTCTAGVAYWSTNIGSWNQSGGGGQGVLDLCTATNTWTSGFYTPYSYPHPLASTSISFNPLNLSFGSQAVNTTSSPLTVTLTNTGSVTLNISSITLQTGAQFAIVANNCGSALGAGSNCSVSVTFTPTSSGSKSDSLIFADDAPGNPQSVPLSGTGVTGGVGFSVVQCAQTPQSPTSGFCTFTSNSCTLTLPQTSNSGDIMVVGMSGNSATFPAQETITALSDSGGSIYVHNTACQSYESQFGQHWNDCEYTLSTVPSTSVTVTRNTSNLVRWYVSACELACLSSPCSLDVIGTADDTVSGTTLPGVPLTLTGSNDAIVQLIAGAPGILSVTAPYTIAPPLDDHSAAAYSVNTNDGTAPTFTFTGSDRGAASAIAFKSAPPPDFSIGVLPTSLTIVQGTNGSATTTISSLNGFNSATTLSASGLPTGVTSAFSPNPVTPPANGTINSTLTLTASASSALGTFTVTVTGTSGSLSHSANLALTVNQAQASGTSYASLIGQASVVGNVVLGYGGPVFLSSITVNPVNPVVAVGSNVTFSAQGNYSNGTQQDVTAQATWASSNSSVATNVGPLFTCVARGATTASATLSGVVGSTTLACQQPTFTPQGPFSVPQGSSSVTVAQFTGANGTSPYTFSSPDLPSWLSLSSTGCVSGNVNCTLAGTPSTTGAYNFHVQLTDASGFTACLAPGCPITVTVTAVTGEDNTYCYLNGSVETVTTNPTPNDAPAGPMPACNYTALSWTTLGSTPTAINVCPHGQLSGGSSVAGCAANPAYPDTYPGHCSNTGGVEYCNTVQAAVNYAYNSYPTNGLPCGADIQIWPTINDTDPTSAQNVYSEPTVVAPGNINCGPDYSAGWWYIRTKQYSKLPPPGNRISPAWAGMASIPNYPPYSQPAAFGFAAGTYIPAWRCDLTAGGQCNQISSQMNTNDASGQTGAVLSGLRIMGIEFIAPHGRDTSTDAYGNNVCPPNFNGTPQCTPGTSGAMIQVGCNFVQKLDCYTQQTVTPQGHPPQTAIQTGSLHLILDRIMVMGCDNAGILGGSCWDSIKSLVTLEGGQHLSIIDSYGINAYCMYGVGPCVDAIGVGGGNPKEAVQDLGFKYVNNFLSAAGENIFWGGAKANDSPHGIEVRRNHFFKPLNWKVDHPSFPGTIPDAFLSKQGTGYTQGQTTCLIDPPISGTSATCSAVVDGSGNLLDILITGVGSGYGLSTNKTGQTGPNRPHYWLTDTSLNPPQTFLTCYNPDQPLNGQLSGWLNSPGSSGSTTTLTWANGDFFIPGLNNSTVTIGGSSYTVGTSGYQNKTTLVVNGQVPSGGNLAFNSNFTGRGDCGAVVAQIPDVKNLGELKAGIGVLWEGNIGENCWSGQSDQDGDCWLLTPKNINNNSPNAQVTDFTMRYNFCRNINHSVQAAMVVATNCPQGAICLPLALTRFAMHDNEFDGMDGTAWAAGTAPVQAGAGGGVSVENAQDQTHATSVFDIEHNTFIGTEPSASSYFANASCMGLFFNMKGASGALLPSITFQNNICAGGVKNVSSLTNGQANCLNETCKDHVSGHSPTEVALRQLEPSDYDNPNSGGNYTTGILNDVAITNAGSCTTAVTGATVSGGGGQDGALGLTGGTSVTKLWIVDVGDGYTGTPSVVFQCGGHACASPADCSTLPTATLVTAGAGLATSTTGCFGYNVMPLQAWPGEIAMVGKPYIGYPTAQISSSNSCSNAGGHNNVIPGGTTPYNVCNGAAGNGPCTWDDVKFVNFLWCGKTQPGFDPPWCQPGEESWTGDLHLTSGSLGHLAGSDGHDIGANIDLVNQYTGIVITNGIAVLPQ